MTGAIAEKGKTVSEQDAPDDDAVDTADLDDVADDSKSATAKPKPATPRQPSAAAAKLRGVGGFRIGLQGLAIILLVIAVGVLGYLVYDKSDQISAAESAANAETKAEQVALDYATGAANMNYKDLPGWNNRLTANTSPELKAKLTEASSSMEQVITPLQWTSTSSPISAKVKSHNGDVYVVTAFVNVMTKNAQAPDGVQSTASYTVTMDSSKNWLITDVGGIDGAVAPK